LIQDDLNSSHLSQNFQWSERKRKRSKRYLSSDDDLVAETDSVADYVGDSGHEFEEENEDDYIPTDPKPTVKGSKAKGKATSVKGGAKRRTKVDNTSEVPAAKKRPKLILKTDEAHDVVGDSSSTPNVSTAGDRSVHTISKHDSPPPQPTPVSQPPPKKQKLPTIKKVKLPNHNTSTSNSTNSTVVIETAAVLPLGGKPIQDGVRKTLNGTIDIDLSNKSIYEEIFSKTVRIAIDFIVCMFMFL
jgi:hypothetical protein